MFDHTTQQFSAKEKIEVLLKEYDSLRAEIGKKTSGGYQLITVLAAILAAVLGLASRNDLRVGLELGISGTVFVVALGVAFYRISRTDTNIIARRVSDIENQIAEIMGDTLLRWETEFGGLNRNLWGSLDKSRSVRGRAGISGQDTGTEQGGSEKHNGR